MKRNTRLSFVYSGGKAVLIVLSSRLSGKPMLFPLLIGFRNGTVHARSLLPVGINNFLKY